MSYHEFSTDKAEYVFYTPNPILAKLTNIPPSIFDGIDAIVTELPHRNRILQKIKSDKVPLFSVDVSTTDYPEEYGGGVNPVTLKYAFFVLTYSLSNKRIPTEVIEYITMMHFYYRQPITAGRSSIAAEKIENGLLKMINEQTPHKKPKIGLIYSMRHADIISYLQDKKLRREMIEHFKKNGYKGLKTEELDRVVQY